MIKKILLIDDDKDDQEIFVEQATEFSKSIEVVSAYNGFEAFEMLKKALPDCIFLDVNMPIMDGLEVLEKLKADQHLKHIPVSMYSTSDGYETRKSALKLGAAHYFQKPYSVNELQQIFQTVFENELND